MDPRIDLITVRSLYERDLGDLWTAILDASRALGLEEFLPQLVVSRLPTNWWPELPRTDSERMVTVTVPHRCPLRGRHGPGECIAALLATTAINRRLGSTDALNLMTPASLVIDGGGRAEITLRRALEDCEPPGLSGDQPQH